MRRDANRIASLFKIVLSNISKSYIIVYRSSEKPKAEKPL